MELTKQEIFDFMNLIAQGNESLIESSVENNKAYLNAVDPMVGMNPLIRAAHVGNAKLIEFFNAKGINIDLQDKMGFTALHRAIVSDKPESVECLLRLNANKYITTNDGITPIMLAKSKNNSLILRLFSGNM